MTSLLQALSEEHIFVVKPGAKSLPLLLEGIVRLIDTRGKTLGVVIDKETLDDLEEDLQSHSPEFLSSLEASRRSGRVSAESVQHKAKLG
jgi:hypothetical protein